MSATVEVDDVTPNLADLDVPMSASAPDPNADYNAAPPPLPELFDDAGRPVPYIADLMLGKDGVKKESYDEKDENGAKTGKKAVYFTADLLGKVIGPFDGRELEVRDYDTFVRPASRFTSFLQRGKKISEVVHLAKIAGLEPDNYPTVGALAPDLAKQLALRGANAIQARVFIQWQWYSKTYEWKTQKGDAKKGKTVRYGMKTADDSKDGVYSPKIVHKETGEELTARAVITRIEPL